jgi:hypothetical protein
MPHIDIAAGATALAEPPAAGGWPSLVCAASLTERTGSMTVRIPAAVGVS